MALRFSVCVCNTHLQHTHTHTHTHTHSSAFLSVCAIPTSSTHTHTHTHSSAFLSVCAIPTSSTHTHTHTRTHSSARIHCSKSFRHMGTASLLFDLAHRQSVILALGNILMSIFLEDNTQLTFLQLYFHRLHTIMGTHSCNERHTGNLYATNHRLLQTIHYFCHRTIPNKSTISHIRAKEEAFSHMSNSHSPFTICITCNT